MAKTLLKYGGDCDLFSEMLTKYPIEKPSDEFKNVAAELYAKEGSAVEVVKGMFENGQVY